MDARANPEGQLETGKATQTKVTLDEIEQIRTDMIEFSEYYE